MEGEMGGEQLLSVHGVGGGGGGYNKVATGDTHEGNCPVRVIDAWMSISPRAPVVTSCANIPVSYISSAALPTRTNRIHFSGLLNKVGMYLSHFMQKT